jgi:hypothetical protein
MISEEEFKRRTSSLEEKLHLLQEKKKLLAEKKSQEQTLAQATNAPAKKAFFSIGASTKNNTVPVAQPAERKGIPLFFGTEKASDVSQTITQNNAGVDPKILESMEAKLQEISEKYNISEKAMVSNLKKFGTDRIIEDFDKLIRLIETEHEEKKKAAEEKKEEKMRFDSVSKDLAEKKKEKDKGIQKEVQVEKLETDFDRIENFVNENGRVKAGQVARALNINPKLVEECARILEQNGLVKIEYPPVGDVNIIAAGYIPKAEKKAEKPKGIKLPKLNIFNRQKK